VLTPPSTSLRGNTYEKAYAKWRTSNTTDKPDYQPLNGSDPVAACAELVPGTSASYTSTASSTADAIYNLVRANSMSRRTMNPMVAWTYARGKDSPDKIKYDAASGVVGWHAYSVLGWDFAKGVRYIVLRNPWGTHEGKVDVKQGNWRAYDISFWKTVPLNRAGVFAMKVETFKKYFAGLGVAK
jgi:hypothetical protein